MEEGKDKKRVGGGESDPRAQPVLALKQVAEWFVELGGQQGTARSWKTSTSQAALGRALLEPIVGSPQIFTHST